MAETRSPKKQKMETDDVTMKAINTLRTLSVDMVQAANSGHPGMPLGCAPMAYSLFMKQMRFNPKNPKWLGRDRFVLSNGHGCALLYSMLHLTGYDRPTREDLKYFRQLNSVVAGHPENFLLEGVEVTTGPLGQGLSNGVGMAVAEAHLAAIFNKPDLKIVDNFTYVMVGDGCLQEGVGAEACSLAGHLKLGKLIVLYDDNKIQIDGSTDLAFSEDVTKRFEAYDWEVLTVADGNTDIEGIVQAIEAAKKNENKPTLIRIRTSIGYGSTKAGTAAVHGAPLGAEEIKKLKTGFGFNPDESFQVPKDAESHMLEAVTKGAAQEKSWNDLFSKYKQAFPELAKEFKRRMAGELPEGWESKIPTYTAQDKADASRSSSGKVLNALAEVLPELMGGSADLTPSNKTWLNCSTNFLPQSHEGRYLRFGVREHAMAAICNGMAAFGGFIPFCATFLNFAGYAAGAMRVTALSKLRVLYIMTHDSIGLGEDGPTHQPIETLALFRAMPNFLVFRPADANEVAGSYLHAIRTPDAPSLFALSRQNLPNLEGSSAEKVAKGAYQLNSNPKPDCILVGTGSEVSILVEAGKLLEKEGLSAVVVSMPCMKLFETQSNEYKKSVFPDGVPVLAMEAAATFGWHRYAHVVIGMESFGKSGPANKLYPYFGFTPEAACTKAKKMVDFFKKGTVPDLRSKVDGI